jgi:hypothetical protein
MPEYRFTYKRDNVRCTYGVTAANDRRAFKRMQTFIKQFNVKYIEGSMMVCGRDSRFTQVPDASTFLQAAE